MDNQTAVVGTFEKIEEVEKAIRRLRAENIPINSVYSPFHSSEIREALGEPSLGPGRFFTLFGAIAGIATGIFLAVYTAAQWRFIVGGKYPIPYVPTVIPAFEFLILFAVFFSLGGMLWLNKMPKRRLSKTYDKRFSQDLFGIVVYCSASDCDGIEARMEQLGAREVRRIE